MMSTSLFQGKNNRVWNAIFQNETWTSIASSHGLNALVGQNLHSIYDIDHTIENQPAYIVLVTGDKSGDIRSYSQIFIDSLRPHTFNETTKEVVFTNSKIVLNIHDALSNLGMNFMDPGRLFSYQDNSLRSAYLYWQDSHYALRTLGIEDVVGIGGKVSDLTNMSLICGIALKRPGDLQKRYCQQRFDTNGLRDRSTGSLPQVGYTYNRDNCLWWKGTMNDEPHRLYRIDEE